MQISNKPPPIHDKKQEILRVSNAVWLFHLLAALRAIVQSCTSINTPKAENPRGDGTQRPMIYVAALRDEQRRARAVSDDQKATLEPVVLE